MSGARPCYDVHGGGALGTPHTRARHAGGRTVGRGWGMRGRAARRPPVRCGHLPALQERAHAARVRPLALCVDGARHGTRAGQARHEASGRGEAPLGLPGRQRQGKCGREGAEARGGRARLCWGCGGLGLAGGVPGRGEPGVGAGGAVPAPAHAGLGGAPPVRPGIRHCDLRVGLAEKRVGEAPPGGAGAWKRGAARLLALPTTLDAALTDAALSASSLPSVSTQSRFCGREGSGAVRWRGVRGARASSASGDAACAPQGSRDASRRGSYEPCARTAWSKPARTGRGDARLRGAGCERPTTCTAVSE